MSRDVHTEHCCARHGCKYSNPDCTVTSGAKPQSFDCEACTDDPMTPLIKAVADLVRDIPDAPASWSPETIPISLQELCDLKRLLIGLSAPAHEGVDLSHRSSRT